MKNNLNLCVLTINRNFDTLEFDILIYFIFSTRSHKNWTLVPNSPYTASGVWNTRLFFKEGALTKSAWIHKKAIIQIVYFIIFLLLRQYEIICFLHFGFLCDPKSTASRWLGDITAFFAG